VLQEGGGFSGFSLGSGGTAHMRATTPVRSSWCGPRRGRAPGATSRLRLWTWTAASRLLRRMARRGPDHRAPRYSPRALVSAIGSTAPQRPLAWHGCGTQVDMRPVARFQFSPSPARGPIRCLMGTSYNFSTTPFFARQVRHASAVVVTSATRFEKSQAPAGVHRLCAVYDPELFVY
jgi:hypothetical protein